MTAGYDGLDEFLAALVPFLQGRPITYVDVGAFVGGVCTRLLESPLTIREAHLFEPNPNSFAALRKEVGSSKDCDAVYLRNIAVGPSTGSVLMVDAGSSCRIVTDIEADPGARVHAQSLFTAPCSTLDELAASFADQRVTLLRIDTAGSEDLVLQGASKLLSEQRVDVVYITTRFQPTDPERCDIRGVEHLMLSHGYRLFGIFEQEHERVDDCPVLGEVSLAYLSPGFAKENPYHLTRRLGEAHDRARSLSQQIESLSLLVKESKDALTVATAEQQRTGRELAELARSHRALEKRAKRQARELRATRQLLRETATASADLTKRASMSENRACMLDEALAAMEREKANLASRLRAAETERARQALELVLVRAERDRLEGERDELAQRCQRENEQRARAEQACSEMKQERDKAARRLEALSSEVRSTEEMNREVFALFNGLHRSEASARDAAVAAFEQAEAARRQLPYRLGACLTKHSRSARGWLTLPGALVQTMKGSGQQAASGVLRYDVDSPDKLVAGKSHALPVKSTVQSLTLPAMRSQVRLQAKMLSVSSSAKVALEISLVAPSALDPGTRLAGRDLGPAELQPGAAKRSVESSAGETLELLSAPSLDAGARLSVRTLREVACILSLTLRGESSADNDHESVTEPKTVARLGRDACAPSDDVDPKWPTPPVSCVIWHAHELIRAGHTQSGIEFAKRHAKGIERPAVNLLLANQHLDDETAWLSFLNEYLQQYGIAPVELLPAGGSRFERLTATPKHEVERGPLVSVIMPAFNAGRLLWRAAGSILKQTWRPLELFIVDDASTDDTYAIAKSLADSDSRVKVLHNSVNVGPYVSKNLALRLARGQYITGHDADDWAHPEAIHNQCEAMLRSDGELQATLTRMLRTTATGQFVAFAKLGRSSDDGARRLASISFMAEADFMRKRLGYWDSIRFGADSELIGRAERILGDGLECFPQLGRLCLDSERSLTNDPVHGVSKLHGISPTRRTYRDAWQAWHRTLAYGEAYLPFPQPVRRFAAPQAALVPMAAVLTNLSESEQTERSTQATGERSNTAEPEPAPLGDP